MTNGNSSLKRVFITGALTGTLLLTSVAALTAQEATAVPDAPAAEAAQSEHGFLGVSLAETRAGARVAEVLAGSPAEAAGIQAGDLITAVNGEAAATAAEVVAAISALSAGDSVALSLDRAGDSVDVTATLTTKPVEPEVEESSGRSGTRFFNIRSRESLTYSSADQTWAVGELSEDAPLYADGLRAGDVITAIDGEQYDPMSLMRHLADVGVNASLTLTVARDGATAEVSAPVLDFVVSAMMGRSMMDGRGAMMLPFAEGRGAQSMPFGQFFSQRGQYQNGYLGVSFIMLDTAVAADRGTSLTDGALVVEVVAGSPAEAAGLLVDDIIIAVNGEPVDAEHTLRDRLIAYEPEDVLALTVVRADAEQEIEAMLGEPAGGAGQGAMNQHRQGRSNSGRSAQRGSRNTSRGAQATPMPTPAPATTGSSA